MDSIWEALDGFKAKMLLRDANDGRSIDMELLETSQENIPIIETTSSVITDNIFNDEKISSLNQNQLPANDIIHNRDIDNNVNRVDSTNSHNSSIVTMEFSASNVKCIRYYKVFRIIKFLN